MELKNTNLRLTAVHFARTLHCCVSAAIFDRLTCCNCSSISCLRRARRHDFMLIVAIFCRNSSAVRVWFVQSIECTARLSSVRLKVWSSLMQYICDRSAAYINSRRCDARHRWGRWSLQSNGTKQATLPRRPRSEIPVEFGKAKT